jgi:hypothetical protein
VLSNLKDSIKVCVKDPFIIVIGLTESLLFATLHIFIFIWTPILREYNNSVDTGEVFTIFMMALMAGGSLFRVIIQIFNLLRLFMFIMIQIHFSWQNWFLDCALFHS